MQELKETGGHEVGEAVAADSVGGRKFALPQLSKRTILLLVAGLVTLILIVTAVFAYRASSEKAKVAAVAAEKAKRDKAEQDKREEENRAEMARAAQEARRSHSEIMEASPSAAVRPEAAKAAVAERDGVASASAEIKPAAAGADVDGKVSGSSRGEALKSPPVVAAPDAAGGCTLSGKSAEDYGKALGRCLEEYNRLEGRSR